jgi:acetoin:2,6-dichlorophenolindophenol oxidoreductase subunit beta
VSETTYIKAINDATARAMRADERVIVIGEDVAQGGPYTATAGLAQEFGVARVRNTPISEAAITGVAIGAAQSGLRPVLEIMFIDFITLALDQLVNQAAKAHLMSGGQLSVPLVVRTQGGAGQRGGAQHSQSLEAWLTHVPGLKVVMPSSAADAAGLLVSAIADPNPVVFVENKSLYFRREPATATTDPIEIGKAHWLRQGKDVTIIALSRMVGEALTAADRLAEEGIEAEVIDPRTLAPLDLPTIMTSIEKTGHVVLVDQATRHASASAVIAAEIAEHGFSSLKGPIKQVTALDATIPYSEPMEAYVLPDEAKISQAVHQVLGSAPVAA